MADVNMQLLEFQMAAAIMETPKRQVNFDLYADEAFDCTENSSREREKIIDLLQTELRYIITKCNENKLKSGVHILPSYTRIAESDLTYESKMISFALLSKKIGTLKLLFPITAFDLLDEFSNKNLEGFSSIAEVLNASIEHYGYSFKTILIVSQFYYLIGINSEP